MTAKEFYLDTPLYAKVIVKDFEHLTSLVGHNVIKEFDGYNPVEKFDTTFKEIDAKSSWLGFDRSFEETVVFICKRTNKEFVFYVRYDGSSHQLLKVGQFPSLADFHISRIKQYDQVLPKNFQREFTRAIGLSANGIGIGAFVYLRRIFEYLVFEAANERNNDGDFDSELFGKMKMGERISYLKSYLPGFLVEHKQLYGILSTGIHELEESVCLLHFESVKVGIELILDEKLEKHQKAQKIEAASAKIQLALQSINTKNK